MVILSAIKNHIAETLKSIRDQQSIRKKLCSSKMEDKCECKYDIGSCLYRQRRLKLRTSPFSCFQKFASLLYEAADDGGYVDPEKVKRILKVSKDDAMCDSDDSDDTEGEVISGTARIYMF